MAISTNVVWETRTAGNDANGGGYSTGGVDRSQSDTPHATYTTAATVHTTTSHLNVPSGEHTVHADDIGNIHQISGGTATVGFYEITSVDVPNNRWICDRSMGTAAQTASGRMGGAVLTIGKLGQACATGGATGNTAWIKAGTYTITSTTANVAGGRFLASSNVIYMEGYSSSRGDLGTKPLIQASGIASTTLIQNTGGQGIVSNLDIDGATLTGIRGLNYTGRAHKVIGRNCLNSGIVGTGVSQATQCLLTGCTTAAPALNGTAWIDCVGYGNTTTAFSAASSNPVYVRCIADTNTGATTDGFQASNGPSVYINCVSYASGRDGFRADPNCIYQSCLAEDNTGVGFNGDSGIGVLLQNCAGYDNTGGDTSGITGKLARNDGFITGTASFFTDAAGQDFSLNTTAGGGADVRNAGFGTFPIATTVGYPDLGAAQHDETASSSGGGSFVFTG